MTDDKTMKCALISAHGDNITELLGMSTTTIPSSPPKPSCHRQLLIQVHACALAPGDVRVAKGQCDLFQAPPNGCPYIPGGDVAGVVVQEAEDSRFRPGDRVLAMFELPRPINGLAEFALVNESNAEILPDNVSFVNAAALTSSAVAAYNAAKTYIQQPGMRVLILGGHGGVGTFLIQLAKTVQKAAFVAVTSSTKQPNVLHSLGADYVVDYTQTVWYQDAIPAFRDKPFDVIFDLGVGRQESWLGAQNNPSILKRSGHYVAMSPHNPEFIVHNTWHLVGLMALTGGRTLSTFLNPFSPNYIWFQGLDLEEGVTLKELLALVRDGRLRVVHDPSSPLPFTTKGIQQGFQLMNDRKAHGKVVVQIRVP